METEVGPTGNPEGTLDYKVTGRRIVAALIDLIPIVVLWIVMADAFGTLGKTTDEEHGWTWYTATLSDGPFFLYCLLALAYFVVPEGLAAPTLGKLIMGLKVVKLDGSSYGWKAALGRNLLRIVDFLPILYFVGLVAIAVTPSNQRLGDLAAGTTVARAD